MTARGRLQQSGHRPETGDQDASGLDTLFDSSPEIPARTTAPATLGLFTGIAAVAISLWSVGLGLAVLLATVSLALSVIGLAKASRPGTAGGSTAALGLVLALLTGALVVLRYAGVDTALADGVSLRPAMEWLTGLLPAPR